MQNTLSWTFFDLSYNHQKHYWEIALNTLKAKFGSWGHSLWTCDCLKGVLSF